MDDWKQVQDDLRNGVYGAWGSIRHEIAEEFALESPGHGLTSSDISHIAYGWVKGGRLEPVVGDRALDAERKMREMLAGVGLPMPDEVQYRDNDIRLLWHERKVAVVIDLEEEKTDA